MLGPYRKYLVLLPFLAWAFWFSFLVGEGTERQNERIRIGTQAENRGDVGAEGNNLPLGLRPGEMLLALITVLLFLATADLADTAKDTAKRQLRAYVGVEPRGVKRFVGKDLLIGHIAIRNFGRIPAKNIAMFVVTDYYLDGSQHNFRIGTLYGSTTTLHPRAEMIYGAATGVDIESIQVADDKEADWMGYIFVYGKVTYTDDFGTKGWTEFCHRYPCEMMDPDIRISRKYGRYHEIAGNNTD